MGLTAGEAAWACLLLQMEIYGLGRLLEREAKHVVAHVIMDGKRELAPLVKWKGSHGPVPLLRLERRRGLAPSWR